MTITQTPDAALICAASLPCWHGKVEPEALGGGLSNRNFVVEDDGEKFVVRLGGDVPEHGILRSHDIAVSDAAYRAGLSPEPIYAQADAQVIRFIDGATLQETDMADPAMMARVVPLVQKCHRELAGYLPGAVYSFDALDACRAYAKALVDNGYRLAQELSSLLELGREMAETAAGHSPRFCHNDFLAANFIDDGARLWLIDWEYGGLNNPMFDLGNLASNNNLNQDCDRNLLELYFDQPADDGLWRSFLAMKVLSLLREAMWSMTAEMHSDLAIDYAAYTDEQLSRLSAARADLKVS